MKTFRIIAAVVVAVVVGMAVAAPPAGAKGPRGATIDGPGLDAPIAPPNPGMSKLPDLTGLYGQVWGGLPQVDEPTATDLGPAYVVGWDLGGDASAEVVQTVYPYAAGGDPLVHTEAGQAAFAEETRGGWFAADPALRDLLVDLGVPAAAEVAEVEVAEPAAADRAGGGSDGWVFPTVLAAAALAAAVATSVGLLRRRTTVPVAEAV